MGLFQGQENKLFLVGCLLHSVKLLWTSDQLVAGAATYITHNKHKKQTSVPSVGLESAISTVEQLQTYALDVLAFTPW